MKIGRSVWLFTVGVALGAATLSHGSPACPMQVLGLQVKSLKKNGVVVPISTTDHLFVTPTGGDGKSLAALVLDPDTQVPRQLTIVQLP